MAAKSALIFSFVYYPRFIGGAELAVKEITDRIDSKDIQFHLIALRLDRSLPREEKIGNVTVHRVGFSGKNVPSADSLPFHLHLNKYLYPVMALFEAGRLYKIYKFDFTWAMMANYSGFAGLFFKIFHTDVPFILTLQEGDPIDYIKKRTRAVSGLFKMIFTHADRIQAISKYLADFGANMGSKNPPIVVPNGVDVNHFSQKICQEDLLLIKQDIGKNADDIFLVTASRLVVKNAVGDIISALSFLPANIKLLVLGQGYQEADLKSQVEKIGLGDRVVFKGFVGHVDLPKYLKACDIFVRPSLSEGFGNSFIEAMAAGLPVIATPVGGIVDFLKNKETGLFCEVNSPKDIARKVEIYLHDKNLHDEIIDNAMHMVIDHYDWKIITQEMRDKAFAGF